MGGSTGRARIALTAALALVCGLGIGRVEANNATYNPADKSLGEISRPSSGTATGSYTLAIISPSQLGGPGGGAFPSGGVVVNAKLTSTSRPDGVSDADALGLVSIVPASQQYTALSQSKNFVVTVTVSPTTAVGDYTYVIQGDPTINVMGWGRGSASFSFSVVEPSPSDITPPTIVLSVPTPVTFCLGGTPVVFSFTASDADSPISSVVAKVNGEPVPVTTAGLGTGDVTGEGVFTAAAIGAYAVTIEATSDGGTGSDTEEARVRYQLTWLPPLSLGKTAKGGSTVPIKFTVRDCHGDFVYDDSVRVAVYELTAGGAVEQLSGVYGTGASSVRIDTTSEQYIVNFQTAPGVRNYAADVWFGDTDEPQGSKTFSVR